MNRSTVPIGICVVWTSFASDIPCQIAAGQKTKIAQLKKQAETGSVYLWDLPGAADAGRRMRSVTHRS